VHKPRAVHRLDRSADRRPAVALLHAPNETRETIAIRRHCTNLDTLTELVKQTEIQTRSHSNPIQRATYERASFAVALR
jgi:hypothetical protein